MIEFVEQFQTPPYDDSKKGLHGHPVASTLVKIVTKTGQNIRYPLSIPELPEPGPELPETEVPDHKFG
jgi:hypothetical protein